MSYWRFHIWVIPYVICSSLTYFPYIMSRSIYVAAVGIILFFLWLRAIALYLCTSSLSMPLSMDTEVASTSWLLSSTAVSTGRAPHLGLSFSSKFLPSFCPALHSFRLLPGVPSCPQATAAAVFPWEALYFLVLFSLLLQLLQRGALEPSGLF